MLVTLTEINTSYTLIGKASSKKSDEVNKVIIELLSDAAKEGKVHSITFDNGTEFSNHHDLRYALKMYNI